MVECPVCKITTVEIQEMDHGEQLDVTCRRCGNFKVTGTVLVKLENLIKPLVLSAWIRSQKEMGRSPPELHSGNVESIVKAIPAYSVSEKQLNLLRAVERRCKFPGAPVNLLIERDHVLNF